MPTGAVLQSFSGVSSGSCGFFTTRGGLQQGLTRGTAGRDFNSAAPRYRGGPSRCSKLYRRIALDLLRQTHD